MEPHQASHGNDHDRAGSGDPGDAAGGPAKGAVGFPLDTGRDPDVTGDGSTCTGPSPQGSERVCTANRVAQDVLVVAGLPLHLCLYACLVRLDQKLAADPFLPPGTALRRLAASDFFADATRWLGRECPRPPAQYSHGRTESGAAISLLQHELSR